MNDVRVALYEEQYRCRLNAYLGAGPGQDGFVLVSDRGTAVKFFDRIDRFTRELEVYMVLRARSISRILNHTVPTFYQADDELRTIEMTVVTRPFVLDFAGAKLPEEVPDFDESIMQEHFEHLQQLFGERWTEALQVADTFRRMTGFVLLDIHPGNIAFND